jgi:AraC-like DNA-binding protein
LLGEPPNKIYAGDGIFNENVREWLQEPTTWAAIYFQHPNVVTINARTFPVAADEIVLFPPGSRASLARTGEGTDHMTIRFNLPATTGKRYALKPLIAAAGQYKRGFRHACDSVGMDANVPISFIWALLHQVAESPAALRLNEALYAAEDHILQNLGSTLRVPEIATAAGISARQLLRMFREEHRMTVQEFIRAKRCQEACRLLSTTDIPVKVIAKTIGVPDLAQFNKLIRAETGAAPRVFRSMVTKV